MKATADDENPCPGYLFQEIGKISHESSSCGQCLLEYLLERLQVESCHVKLKVLKIFVHLCSHGSNQFLTELRRNSTFIQQASVYSGPPDPIHGSALYQKVRNTAQEVARLLFTDTFSAKSTISAQNSVPQAVGMGSGTHQRRSGMQGFGNSPGKNGTGGDSLLDKIQKAAEVVASAVLPPTEHQGIRLLESHYRAVMAPASPIEVAVPACAYNLQTLKPKASTRWCRGQIGGGWEETDSGNSSSHNSSQEMVANSRTSEGSKSAGTESQSEASKESSGDLSERVEALQLGDCGQEVALISRLTEGSKIFLSREESQSFIKECSILNCEVVLELLSSKLQEPSNNVQMRALCAVSCLLTSDLLSLEQMFGATQRRLRQLCGGAPGPVANKATKILRQFEALMGGGGSSHTQRQEAENHQPPPHLTSTDSPVHSRPPRPADPVTAAERDSPGEPPDDGHPDTESSRNQSGRSGAAGVQTDHESADFNADGGASPPTERELQLPGVSRLSLFSGMQLVTKGRAQCHSEQMVVSGDGDDDQSPADQQPGVQASSTSSSAPAESSQPPSAFSFLNL